MIRLIRPRICLNKPLVPCFRFTQSSLLKLRSKYGSSKFFYSTSPPLSNSTINPTQRTTTTKSRSNRYKKLFIIGIGIGLTGTIFFYTNDKFKHSILTIDRVGVVVLAMTRCFALYKETLGKEFSTPEERQQALSKTHKKAATITLKALEKNGGIYIKLGQHLSALTYLLPPEWTETMIPLQDKCPRSSVEEIEKMFETDLGLKLSDIFIEFDPNPIGVASLAQVHIAKLRSNGEKVAVKVQHPSLKEFVPLDVELINMVFNLMYKVFPEYPMTWLGEETQNSIFTELDFTKEAENSKRTAEHFKNFEFLKIPKIIQDNKRILIMEYVSGARLDNLKYLKDNNIDPSKVSTCLTHIFNDMIFTPDVGLHCDPHGGNLAIKSTPEKKGGYNFEIVLYDHGLYRDIPLQIKRDYSHFWLAVLDNDVPKMKKYAKSLAGIEGEQKFKIFISAITGRTPEAVLNNEIKKKRSANEVFEIQSQINDDNSGILEDLMDILSNMPRMILLILKTNDLTRHLDENLQSDLGPERTFLIMANYCAKNVYDEKNDIINTQDKGIKWVIERSLNWFDYHKRLASLFIYDIILKFRNFRLKL
ncbi:uncharacterized protein KGF55_002246 [Candida pseudojiufengensis]|uniref:uncharacterized protein n=1 Tax=Candida pseudojiufengensis TaxID=497109 RepID=UPI0022252BFE|nr:uncharacterized protein KGF55_002246 [Candida pseudojiufengensis]KAI5964304.1 hypothetical protein KGF55_002246 [Candida pseudojiufengensis]